MISFYISELKEEIWPHARPGARGLKGMKNPNSLDCTLEVPGGREENSLPCLLWDF